MSDRAPWPPADLARRHPAIRILRAGTALHRFHARPHHPIHFDRSLDGRFNSPDGGYGVLYAAHSRRGAFAETFLREPGRTLLPLDLLATKAYATIKTSRALRLVRLYGRGLAVIGCTAEVAHGGLAYAIAQQWSSMLHHHPMVFDGIAYRSRHDDDAICVAIFERARDALTVQSRESNLDQDWFYELMNYYRVGIAPSG